MLLGTNIKPFLYLYYTTYHTILKSVLCIFLITNEIRESLPPSYIHSLLERVDEIVNGQMFIYRYYHTRIYVVLTIQVYLTFDFG